MLTGMIVVAAGMLGGAWWLNWRQGKKKATVEDRAPGEPTQPKKDN